MEKLKISIDPGVLIFISLLNAGVIICLTKWGIMDAYEYRKKRWMPDRCEFCMAFWLGIIEMLLRGYTNVLEVFFYAFIAAVITRKFI